jgi:tetratricopeptide (TPR) repeat protein
MTLRTRSLALFAAGLLLVPAAALAAPRAAGKRPASTASSAPAASSAQDHPLARLLAEGKYADGLQWLRSFGKGTAEEDRYRGLFHHGLGQTDAALQYLLPAYRARTADDTVALAVAEASLWKKDAKTANAVVSQLEQRDAPEALRVRGLLLEQAGKLTEALALYERAIPMLPQPWGTMERKAQVLSWLKRFDEAAATYGKVAASAKASIELRRRCRVRIAELTAWKKDFDGALAQLARLLAEEPRLTDALLLRGQIMEWKGEFAEAKRAYSRVLALDAGHPEARLRLDKLLWVE